MKGVMPVPPAIYEDKRSTERQSQASRYKRETDKSDVLRSSINEPSDLWTSYKQLVSNTLPVNVLRHLCTELIVPLDEQLELSVVSRPDRLKRREWSLDLDFWLSEIYSRKGV